MRLNRPEIVRRRAIVDGLPHSSAIRRPEQPISLRSHVGHPIVQGDTADVISIESCSRPRRTLIRGGEHACGRHDPELAVGMGHPVTEQLRQSRRNLHPRCTLVRTAEHPAAGALVDEVTIPCQAAGGPDAGVAHIRSHVSLPTIQGPIRPRGSSRDDEVAIRDDGLQVQVFRALPELPGLGAAQLHRDHPDQGRGGLDAHALRFMHEVKIG